MSKKKAKRTALRRRQRSSRDAIDSQRILGALNAARAPLTREELAARLHVPRHARREFERSLGELERAGEVVQNRAGSLLVSKRIALVAGRVEGHPDGHGFLVPDEGGAPIFLTPGEMRQLMHGDRAAVRISGRDLRGRAIGEVVEVLERANRRIVGRLHSEHGVLFLGPEDRRIAHDILVPPAETGRAKAGQVVTVDLVAQPGPHAQPIGRVAEVLGHHADPGMEIEIAVRKFDLPHEFSRKALAQARSLPDEVTEFENRKDLRSLHFVTIDGENAKDFVEWKAWMAKYNPGASLADAFNVYAYSVSFTMHEVLKRCGHELTRANIMKQAASLRDLEVPLLLPGIRINTSPTDFYPIQAVRLQRFKGETWELFGDVLHNESE